jgi:probable phosphoglycerate mutase
VSADPSGGIAAPPPGGAPRRLLLLRHGRTAWNATGRAQGHADVELDEVGHTQAAAVAPWVAGWRPAALWSSDLARARQTAAYVEKETGLTAVPDARLREYDVGQRTGMTMAEFAEQHPDEHAAWLQDRREELPGAEQTSEVLARTLPAYDEVLAGLAPGGTAVVVTHGAALKVSVLALLGWPPGHGEALEGLHNCGVAVLEQGSRGRRWRLVAWNAGPEGADFVSAETAR